MLNEIDIANFVSKNAARRSRKKLAASFSIVFIVVIATFFGLFCFGSRYLATNLGRGVSMGIVIEQGIILFSIAFCFLYLIAAARLDRRLQSREY